MFKSRLRNQCKEGSVIQLGDSEIEEIIAKDLTRGQIVVRFGVGEHAAQLARTQALAIRRERQRAASTAPSALDLDDLHVLVQDYLEHLRATGADGRIGTDRSKLSLFLTWLAEQVS